MTPFYRISENKGEEWSIRDKGRVMPKSNNQKGKILYLERILHETGEDRTVTMQEILSELLKYGVTAERKSIYDDMEVLRSFGMDVRYRRGRPGGYYLAGQKAPEKTETESKEAVYQVAEVQDAQVAEKQEAAISGTVWKFDPGVRRKDMKTLKLLCGNSVKKEVQDYFGDFAQYKDKGAGYFTASVQVAETPQFYGWLTAMGHEVHIAKPKKAAQAYRDYLKGLAKEYKGI